MKGGSMPIVIAAAILIATGVGYYLYSFRGRKKPRLLMIEPVAGLFDAKGKVVIQFLGKETTTKVVGSLEVAEDLTTGFLVISNHPEWDAVFDIKTIAQVGDNTRLIVDMLNDEEMSLTLYTKTGITGDDSDYEIIYWNLNLKKIS
jgi:hypothetical protein